MKYGQFAAQRGSRVFFQVDKDEKASRRSAEIIIIEEEIEDDTEMV